MPVLVIPPRRRLSPFQAADGKPLRMQPSDPAGGRKELGSLGRNRRKRLTTGVEGVIGRVEGFRALSLAFRPRLGRLQAGTGGRPGASLPLTRRAGFAARRRPQALWSRERWASSRASPREQARRQPEQRLRVPKVRSTAAPTGANTMFLQRCHVRSPCPGRLRWLMPSAPPSAWAYRRRWLPVSVVSMTRRANAEP